MRWGRPRTPGARAGVLIGAVEGPSHPPQFAEPLR
jgi:hypothetical protein